MPSDTTPEAEEILVGLMRRATVAEKIARVRSLSATVIQLSRRAIARAHPHWTPLEVQLKFVELHYGQDLADRVRAYLKERDGESTGGAR